MPDHDAPRQVTPIRLSPAERAVTAQAARVNGQSLSAFVRDAALTADWTRSYRTDRKLMRDATELIEVAAPMLEMIIDGCDSVDELVAAYHQYRDMWTPLHTRIAAARKAALTGASPRG